jgi:hypothetical protein
MVLDWKFVWADCVQIIKLETFPFDINFAVPHASDFNLWKNPMRKISQIANNGGAESRVLLFLIYVLCRLIIYLSVSRKHIRELNDNKRQHSSIFLHIQDVKSFIPVM